MRTATWFGLWAVAGAATSLGVLTLLTIGVFVLPAAIVLCGVLAWRAPRWGWVASGWCRPRLGPARRR